MKMIPTLNHGLSAFMLLLCLQIAIPENVKAQDNDPWSTILQLSGKNYWRTRLPIEIENITRDSLKGSHIQIPLSALNATKVLISENVGHIRLTDSNGDELLFDCKTDQGIVKHTGKLEVGDILTIPVMLPGLKESNGLTAYPSGSVPLVKTNRPTMKK